MSANGDHGDVGFIGLGVMGREMVRSLLRAGYAVGVYDVDAAAAAALAADGAKPASSVADAVAGVDIAITMLPDTPQVEEVALGNGGPEGGGPGGGGLRDAMPEDALYVDMSTIAPAASRTIHDALAQAGIAMLDAPVSGGPMGAKDATLSIMVGGEVEAFRRAEPYLRAMGTTITHVGASGAGQTVKLCNQLVCGVNLQAICEALALARASGVDLGQMRDVLLGGSAASWMLDRLGPMMIDGDVGAGFRIDLMLKDLRLVQELARQVSVPLPAAALVTTQYLDARAHGEGSNGNQALFRVYDRMTGQNGAGRRSGSAGAEA